MPFTERQRFDGPAWVRDDGRVYIVHYDDVPGHRLAFYAVYKVAAHLPRGRDPWTVDNRRIGTAQTLDEAMEVARKEAP